MLGTSTMLDGPLDKFKKKIIKLSCYLPFGNCCNLNMAHFLPNVSTHVGPRSSLKLGSTSREGYTSTSLHKTKIDNFHKLNFQVRKTVQITKLLL